MQRDKPPVTFLKDNIFISFQEVKDGFDGVNERVSNQELKINELLFKNRIPKINTHRRILVLPNFTM